MPFPSVPQNSIAVTQITEWSDGCFQAHQDDLAVEEPLEIRIATAAGPVRLTVTMRTPGHDRELAAGLLLSEGILTSPDQILSLTPYTPEASARANGMKATLDGVNFDPAQHQRGFASTSACGLCGKSAIEAIRQSGLRAPNPDLRVDPEFLCSLPDQLRAAQTVFTRTGGLHAAALFDARGNLLVLREDIGRHNAVDKVVGWALLEGKLPLSEAILLVSGRGGFEIIQKALCAGIPVLASVSAPSSLAVQLARELNLTLIGFLRERRFVVYSGLERLTSGDGRA